MNKKKILVIDDKPKNIEILVGGLINSHFQVVTSDSGFDGLQKAHHICPDLILIDAQVSDLNGHEFLSKIKEDSTVSDIPVLLLTTNSDIEEKINAFENGAKDYIIKPLHVSEIVAKAKMILSRLDRRQMEQKKDIGNVSGKLEGKGLLDLVEDLSAQRFSGILNLTNNFKKNGQIFFVEGQVVNSTLNGFHGEKAVYQMVSWTKGEYTIITQDVDVEKTITIGNIDLTLQSKKRIEKRRKLLLELPSSDTIFKLSNTFVTLIEDREMPVDIIQFIELLDGKRSVDKIMNDSKLDDLVAIERIVKMYEQGFLTEVEKPRQEITVEEETTTKKEPIFLQKEFEVFQKRVLGSDNGSKRLLAIIGTASSGKSELIQTLACSDYQEKTMKSIFPNPVEIGKFLAADDLELTLLGVPVEKQLGIFLDSFEENILGYIIIINAIEPESFSYLGYLLKTFRSQYQLPYAIAITNLRHPQAIGIETLAQELYLEDFEELVPCNPSDSDNVKMVFLSMYSPFSNRGKLNSQTNISHFN